MSSASLANAHSPILIIFRHHVMDNMVPRHRRFCGSKTKYRTFAALNSRIPTDGKVVHHPSRFTDRDAISRDTNRILTYRNTLV